MLKNKKIIAAISVVLLIAIVILIVVLATRHKHEYKEVVTEPTCVDKGYTTYTCSCGDSYISNEVDPLGHSYSDWTVIKEATVDEEGLKEKECIRCNDKVSETIAKLDHTHNYTSVVTNPTCVDKGYTTYTCSCSDSYKDNEVDPLGHSYSDWTVIKEATVDEEGLKEKECIRCNDKVSETIAKLDHTHNYTSVVTNPTCVDKGYTTYTCSCGDSYISNEVDPLGHTEELIPGKEATCTESGLTEGKKCSVCNETLVEQVEIETIDHAYTEEVTEPTCVDKGYTTYTCSCGDSYKDNETNALGHTEEVIPAKEATCTEKGLTEGKKCSVCNETLVEQVEIETIDHAYTEEVTEPTCTSKGYTTYTCKCGDSYKDNETDVVDHDYKEFSKIEATCKELGYVTYKCSYCEDIQLEVVDYADHKFEVDTCSVCGLVLMGKPYEENGYTYINLGMYPQSVVTDLETIKALSTIYSYNSLGYIEYNGNEYKRTFAYIGYNDEYKFNNGDIIVNDRTYYCLVEPIKWRVLSEDANSYTLLCDNIIYYMNYFKYVSGRTDSNGNSIATGNYEYSSIRAWLNSYDGSSYNVDNYTKEGFYNVAFNEEEKAIINTTLVDNSANSTHSSTNKYTCNDTYDKVYLLSYKDALNPAYGFETSENASDINKAKMTTDYVRCMGAMSVNEDSYGKYEYWMRSTQADADCFVNLINSYGFLFLTEIAFENPRGVCPAINISK